MSDFTTAFLKYYLTNPLIISILVLGLISAIFTSKLLAGLVNIGLKKP